jgi:enamine deaminase RidA (YjgF/YER057c/UK114 family)
MPSLPGTRHDRAVSAAAASGLTWPTPAPTHEFLPAIQVGELVYVSGHAPFGDGRFQYRGRVGDNLDLPAGQQAARLAVLGCLLSLEETLGDLEAVLRIVKVNGYVQCTPGFEPLPQITDAASRLLMDVFGTEGRHARTTIGVASLPSGVAVELDMIATAARVGDGRRGGAEMDGSGRVPPHP